MPPRPPSLLSLPPELRIQIYGYLVVSPVPLTVYTDFPSYFILLDLNLAILRTCKIIHTETTPLLYGSNTFRFSLRNHIIATNARRYRTTMTVRDVCEDIVRGKMRYEALTWQSVTHRRLERDTLRKMRHIEIHTTYDVTWLRRKGENFLYEKAKVLLDILTMIAGGENEDSAEADEKPNGTIRITVQESPRRKAFLDIWTSEFDRPSEQRSVLEKLLQRVAVRREFEIWVTGSPGHSSTKVENPTEYVLRMLELTQGPASLY